MAYFGLRAEDGAVEPGMTVVAYDAVETSSASDLGRSAQSANADGKFEDFELNRADRREIYLVAVDDAGNMSDSSTVADTQAELVRQVEWTATLIDKVSGQNLPNPHQIRRTEHEYDRETGRDE